MVDQLFHLIPPMAVYVIVAVVIGVESLGIPIPGEITLVAAALLSSRHELNVSPLWVGIAASAGAICGDSIGYAIGRRWGRGLFDRLGARFPRHFGPEQIAYGERAFARWGVWAVFFGRFIALLRILAGPLAGVLRMPYPKFLLANALGGICWAGGTTAAVYYLGVVAEHWLSNVSWIGLGIAVALGVTITFVVKRRMGHHAESQRAEHQHAEGQRAPDVPAPADPR